jgi:hypothetical protein
VYGPKAWFNYGTIFSRDQADPSLIPLGTQIIHGHFLADAFDQICPDRTLITWVRHPVERVVSNYFHFLRSPDMRDDCCRALHENGLTLRQFSELDWMTNETTRYLAAKPLDDFAFVGIAERFAESVRLFSQVMEIPAIRRLPVENVNPDRKTKRYDLAAGDFEHILERNRRDLEWYEQAVDRLNSLSRPGRSGLRRAGSRPPVPR